MQTTLSQARRTVTNRLAGLELPAAFQIATVNAALNATERKTVSARVSRRRLNEKALKLSTVSP